MAKLYERYFTAYEVISLIRKGIVSHIDFDHDLGDPEITGDGSLVVRIIEELAFYKKISPISWNIHSANPIGKSYIQKGMKNAERYWNKD